MSLQSKLSYYVNKNKIFNEKTEKLWATISPSFVKKVEKTDRKNINNSRSSSLSKIDERPKIGDIDLGERDSSVSGSGNGNGGGSGDGEGDGGGSVSGSVGVGASVSLGVGKGIAESQRPHTGKKSHSAFLLTHTHTATSTSTSTSTAVVTALGGSIDR